MLLAHSMPPLALLVRLALVLFAATLLRAQDGRDVGVFRRDAAPVGGKRLAVVVGLDEYASLRRLNYADRDADDVARELEAIGFAVMRMRLDGRDGAAKPLTATSVLTQVEKMCRLAKGDGTVLFYFSGHGFEDTAGRTFLCPYETDVQKLALTGLDLEEVQSRLVASGVRQRLLVVDMCRNDPSKSAGDRGVQLQRFAKAQGTGLLFSTAPGSRSFEPEPGMKDEAGVVMQNGLFTHYLLRGLRGEADRGGQAKADGLLTFREVAYFVSEGLTKLSMKYAQCEQEPYLRWDGTAEDVLLRVMAEPVVLAPADVTVLPQSVTDRSPKSKYSSRTGHLRDQNVWRPNIEAGLRWLKDHQDEDGKWDCDGFMKHDDAASKICDGQGNAMHDIGVTGLALLAFLGDGSTIRSGPHKEVIKNGVTWLREQQQENGLFGTNASHDFVYDHAIAAYAMCEAYGLSGLETLRPTAQNAIDYLESHRNPYSVWRYQPRDNDNDTSVTGWCIMAYASADSFGLEIDREAMKMCAQWLDQVSDPSGLHGYTRQGEVSARKPGDHAVRFPTDKGHAMTAVGLLCRMFMGQHPEDEPVMNAAAGLLLDRPPVWDDAGGSIDHYYWFHATHALFQMGGRRWSRWQGWLGPAVAGRQHLDQAKQNLYGSWDPKCVWSEDGGRVAATALLVLTLEAPHRFIRFLE
ncbi:MAG: caspase family protein [Planctomycetes bacterium]|jgi:hypothetical protein|nr:caspase family protein [Planctomycetota bacterium]